MTCSPRANQATPQPLAMRRGRAGGRIVQLSAGKREPRDLSHAVDIEDVDDRDAAALWMSHRELDDAALVVGDVDVVDDRGVEIADLGEVALADRRFAAAWGDRVDRYPLGVFGEQRDHRLLVVAVRGGDVVARDALGPSHRSLLTTGVGGRRGRIRRADRCRAAARPTRRTPLPRRWALHPWPRRRATSR